MDPKRVVRVSKLLSYGLRHEPGELGLVLDEAGWAAVDQVLAALAARGEPLTRDELVHVVATSDKQRFALSVDGRCIRANQGHSVTVRLDLPAREPPESLFHGTVDRFLPSIRERGLLRGSRTHVHLSMDRATARVVAARRKGKPVILVVWAAQMHRDGFVFHRSENGVWLTEHVPREYLVYPP